MVGKGMITTKLTRSTTMFEASRPSPSPRQYFAEKAENPGQKEALYQKLASPAQPSSDVENKPPDPPPIETIPGRKASPMDLTPPMTPPFRSVSLL